MEIFCLVCGRDLPFPAETTGYIKLLRVRNFRIGVKGFFASVISESAPNLSAAAGHLSSNGGLGGAAGYKRLLRVRNFRIRTESFRGRRSSALE